MTAADDALVLLAVGDGAGAARRALDLCLVSPSHYLHFSDHSGARVAEYSWPGVILGPAREEAIFDALRGIASLASGVHHVLWAWSSDSEDWDSTALWSLPSILARLNEVSRTWKLQILVLTWPSILKTN